MSVGGGAIVRCSAPPAESCGEEYDDVPEGNTVWSATLTVGSRMVGTDTYYGWNSNGIYTGGSLTDPTFTFGAHDYEIGQLDLEPNGLTIGFPTTGKGDIATRATRDALLLKIDSDLFYLGQGTLSRNQRFITWIGPGLRWSAGDSVAIELIELPTPNAYGYRTIWNALMTAEEDPNDLGNTFGYRSESYGKLTNNLIVRGRTDRGIIDDQFRYPWSGYEVDRFVVTSNKIRLGFNQDAAPNPAEAAGWTLSLKGGVELPFAGASRSGNRYTFNYDPSWTDGDQVLVSIRTISEVQNRYGQVALKARRSTKTDGVNLVYGKTHYTYPRQPDQAYSHLRGDGRFGPRASWDLLGLRVTTDKTGDTDPVWITATFRAPNQSDAWTGYWEGQFDDFHTLFLRWIYHEGGVGKGVVTYTLPLRAAATEGGIQRSRSGRDVSFTWVRTSP